MSTNRGDFAGTGKIWVNGTLFSEAAKISVTLGGQINRVVTTGLTGETVEDPTKAEVQVEGAILKRNSQVSRLKLLRRSQEDVTVKVQVGTVVTQVACKVGPIKFDTENGKSTFSTTFMGDEL